MVQKTFFPREECVMHNCSLNIFFGSTLKYTQLCLLNYFSNNTRGKTLTVVISAVTEV